MKYKNIYTIILLIVAALVLSWAIPALTRIGTTTGQNYPFVYYSSLLQDFCIREKADKGKPSFYDLKGNKYTKTQYDSITPLLSYRQLLLSNSMPDTILGVHMDINLVKAKSVFWRYSPREVSKPAIDLYTMFESMSGRVTLESPDDVFRLKDNIEFIDFNTNTVNKEKSDLFQQALQKNNFAFPAKKVWGNLSPKKPYDEGYFVLDNNSQLFHIKMVNGKPYVRDTKAGQNIDIAYFSILEVADKSIYGFILGKNGSIYTLNTEGYSLTKFDIPDIDIDTQSVLLMGNVFYWMVYVTTPNECVYNVLDAKTLKQHDKPYTVKATADRWDSISSWLFPVYVNLADKNTEYIQPSIVTNWGKAFIISALLGLAVFFTIGRKKNKVKRFSDLIITIIFGIPGLIASLIIK